MKYDLNEYNIAEGTLEFGDHTMDYAVFGKGEKPLLLIRGLNITRLQGTVPNLIRRYRTYADAFRIYVIDRREPLPEVITDEYLAEDVYEGAKALGLEKTPVIGNSQGGMIAQFLVLNHPEMVEKLVLNVTTSTPNPVLRKNVEDWVRLTETEGLGAVSDSMMSMIYPPGKEPVPSEDDEPFVVGQKTHPPQEFIALSKACLTCDTKDRLHEIKCPVLVLGGGKDVIMSPGASIELAEGLGTEAVIYEDLGHGAYEDKGYQARVLAFLNE